MSNETKEQEKSLQEIWSGFLRTERETDQSQTHLPDALLYDLALGEPLPERRQEALGHLADCDECVRRLVAFQAAIATDKKVGAVWNPKVLHAAGKGQSPPVIADYYTEDGKYRISLQPTRDGQQDLLTLKVTDAFKQELEDRSIILVSSEGTMILRGTVSAGSITRLVDRKFREEWPFRVHAG